MPLTRYQIRDEYSLADPELYRAADRDDPEALLEGVAMAGLVGVLRQLGDLAEFAAEIFHDLHEEVMATAARGHGLMIRVQQLEAEFPSIEKAFLSQTSHSLFFYNTGVDWHPNLHTDQNLITRGDLPRFVMDSYEECRGPPRLFLLDKFDVAGAGACLKRYTDPSLFKVEAASSGMAKVEVQREKKIRKVKKKGSRWKNGETPEVLPASHAKLHQLFLEERVEKGNNDPARRVKLKKRQLNGSPFDSKTGKSYMEKFLETPSPECKVVCETSVNLTPLKLTSSNTGDTGLEILEIGTVSPAKDSLPRKRSICSSPNAQETVLKPSMDELGEEVIDGVTLKVPEPNPDGETQKIPSFHKVADEKELAVDGESKTEGSVDGYHSDDVTSEIDNYMDALTTMESEMETDTEGRPKNVLGFLNIEKHRADSNANEEQQELQGRFSDSQSIGNSTGSDDGNSSFKRGRSSFSYSDTLGNLAENTPSDGDGAAKVFPSTEICVAEIVDMSSDQLSVNEEIPGTKSHGHVVPTGTCIEVPEIPSYRSEFKEASCSSCVEDLNPMLLPLDPGRSLREVDEVGPERDEAYSDCIKLGSGLSNTDENGTNLGDNLPFTAIGSDVPSQTKDDFILTVSAESHPVDEFNGEDPNVFSDALLHLSNISELPPEKRSSDNFVNDVVQTEYEDDAPMEHLVNRKIGSPHSIISELPPEKRSNDNFVNDVLQTEYEDDAPTEDLVNGKIGSPHSIISSTEEKLNDLLQTEYEDDAPTEDLVNGKIGSPHSIISSAEGQLNGSTLPEPEACSSIILPPDNLPPIACDLDVVKPDDIVSEVNDAIQAAGVNSENLNHYVDTPQTRSLPEQQFSEMTDDVLPLELDSAKVDVPYSGEKTNLEGVSSTADGEGIGGSTCNMDTVGSDAVPLELPSDSPNYPGPEDHVHLDDVLTETNQVEAVAATAGNDDDDVSDVFCPSPDMTCSPYRNLKILPESLSSFEDSHQKGLEINKAVPPEYLIESDAQKEEPAGAPTGLDSVPVSYDHSNSELLDNVPDSSLAEQSQNSFCLGDVTTAPTSSKQSDENSELKSPHQSHLLENTEDAVSSPTCYLLEPEIPLEQALELKADQLDVECMHADIASSKSSNFQYEQIHFPNHIDPEICFDAPSESCPEDLPSQPSASEYSPQSAGQKLESSVQAMDPLDSIFPSFSQLPEATQVNLEEMPPLPPLPPMQWRVGKLQHAPIASEREMVEHNQESFPPIPPFKANEKAQFGFPALEGEILQPRNPFLPLSAGEDEKSHVSEYLVGNSVQPSPLSLQMPTVVNDDNSQHDVLSLERTQSLNPFLTLPPICNESPQHGFLALEGEMVQTSLNPFSPLPTVEDTTRGHAPVSLQEKLFQPLNQLAPETGLDDEKLQQTSQNSEGEMVNPPDTFVPPPTVEDEQPLHDLLTSEGETAWSSSTSILLPTFEDEKPNGNPSMKVPRPRSPLIEAVAAHDKRTLRKVTERVRPEIPPKVDERDSLLEQIRTKSFNLKPAVMTRPSIQGPKTNLKVAAILEKANAIRQALTGSDEDDDADGWSDS